MATSFSGGKSRSTRGRTTDHGQATGKLKHLRLRVECTFFVIYKVGRVLAIGLYELLGNPAMSLIGENNGHKI